MTGGAGFIASHVVILLCKKYPQHDDRADFATSRADASIPTVLVRPRYRSRADASIPTLQNGSDGARATEMPGRRRYKILNFDRLDYCSCLANLEEVAKLPNYKFVKGDICSADIVNYVLETEKIDTIMHISRRRNLRRRPFGPILATPRLRARWLLWTWMV